MCRTFYKVIKIKNVGYIKLCCRDWLISDTFVHLLKARQKFDIIKSFRFVSSLVLIGALHGKSKGVRIS